MRPMSDAPKDGTPILLRIDDSEHDWVIAFWSEEVEVGGKTIKDDYPGWYTSECSSNPIWDRDILGWEPLPEKT